MIRRSPEIEAIARRWTELIRSHRVDDLPHYLSKDDALLYIGTSDGEFWRGQPLREGLAAHMAEVPDFTEDGIEIEAWENGDTGWASYKSRFTFHGTGASGVHRATFVFVMERGSWKMVQHHISQPDSNVEKMGVEHHALHALVDAARAGFRLDQRDGTATIMFTDIANSSAIAAALGDRVWASAVADHFDMLTDRIAAQGGQLIKSLGDGTMSSFSSARAALSAAVAIQEATRAARSEPPLALRIGIHSGDVIQTEDDFFGNVVNAAARIAAAAAPGEIRLSEATRLLAGEHESLSYGDPAEVTLKGLPGTHRLYRLDLSQPG